MYSNAPLSRQPPQPNEPMKRMNANISDYINNSTVTRSGNVYPKTAGKRRTRRHRRKSIRKRNTKRRRHRH